MWRLNPWPQRGAMRGEHGRLDQIQDHQHRGLFILKNVWGFD